MSKVEGSFTPVLEKNLAGSDTSGNNGLLLYSYHHCFYTQKVLMALHEKKIPFTIKTVDITKKEQYQDWFLKINPKGEVPVLKDGIKHIPDSERIINYLEDNFSNGEHSRLIPINQGPEIKQKVIKFHKLIDSVPVHFITLGSLLYYKEYSKNLRYPFVIPLVQTLLKASMSSDPFRDLAVKKPEYASTFQNKSSKNKDIQEKLLDKENYLKVLKEIADLLDEVEEELSTHKSSNSDWWLCCDRFTIADLALAILLDRLSRVGLEAYFWGHGKRQNIDIYYKRVQERDSYKKTIPTFMTDVSIFLRNKAPFILGVSLLTVLTVVVGRFLYFKK